MARRLIGVILLAVTYNFLFLASSNSHVKVGLVWLVVTLAVWWPDIVARLRWLKR